MTNVPEILLLFEEITKCSNGIEFYLLRLSLPLRCTIITRFKNKKKLKLIVVNKIFVFGGSHFKAEVLCKKEKEIGDQNRIQNSRRLSFRLSNTYETRRVAHLTV